MANKKSITKQKSSLAKDIDLLFELGSLRFVGRTWRQFLQVDVANNAEHMFRVTWIALVIARHEGVTDEEKIMKMALLHDVTESRAPDTNYLSKIYSERDEEKALDHMLSNSILKKEFEDLYKEYEKRESIEAKIVKDADNLDVDFELMELKAKGHSATKVWKRTNVEKKLFTKTAKKIWKEIQVTNPYLWHVKAHNTYTAEKDRK